MNYRTDYFHLWYVGSRIYGGHKICEFDINWPSGYRDTRGGKQQIAVPVNNTLVHHTAFLTTDT